MSHFSFLAFTLISASASSSALAQAADAVVQTSTPDSAAQTTTRATPIATTYPAEATGDGAVAAGYALSRWAEDWRRYSDPALRDDPLDRLKFLPLTDDNSVYLTLSGEARARVESFSNSGLRETVSRRADTLRLFAGADLHVGSHLRFYGELAHGGVSGARLGPQPGHMRNRLAVQQAFGDVAFRIADTTVGVRYGRQHFADGSGLLVGQGDGGNLQVVLNGLRGWVHLSRVRADVFDLRFTRYGRGWLSDDDANDRRFSGVTTGVVLPSDLFGGSRLYLEPFAWRLRDRDVARGARVADEVRRFYGLRLWGDAGPVTLDWTVDRQTGRFGAQDISAWQVFAAQTLRLGAAGTSPRIGVHADYGSGGGYAGGALRQAAAPVADLGYYSYQDAFTPTNFLAVAPNFTFSPVARLRATAEYQFAWRPTGDAAYFGNGAAYAGTQDVQGSHLADIARIQAVWSLTPRVSVTGRYEHLTARTVLTRAGYRNADYVGGWISMRL